MLHGGVNAAWWNECCMVEGKINGVANDGEKNEGVPVEGVRRQRSIQWKIRYMLFLIKASHDRPLLYPINRIVEKFV